MPDTPPKGSEPASWQQAPGDPAPGYPPPGDPTPGYPPAGYVPPGYLPPGSPTPGYPPPGYLPPSDPVAGDAARADAESAARASVRSTGMAAGLATVAFAGGIAAVNFFDGPGRNAIAGTPSRDADIADIAASSATVPTGSAETTSTPDPTTPAPDTTTSAETTASETSDETSADPTWEPENPTSPALVGSWTGSISGGGTPVGTRITFDSEYPDAVTGLLEFADPQTGTWVRGGDVTGQLDELRLTIETESQVKLTLVIDGDSANGEGTLLSDDDPSPVTITLIRD